MSSAYPRSAPASNVSATLAPVAASGIGAVAAVGRAGSGVGVAGISVRVAVGVGDGVAAPGARLGPSVGVLRVGRVGVAERGGAAVAASTTG